MKYVRSAAAVVGAAAVGVAFAGVVVVNRAAPAISIRQDRRIA